MTPSERVASLALDRCRATHAPDDRVACFAVDAEAAGGGVRLSGAVSSPRLKAEAVEAVRRVVDGPVSADGVTVLDDERRDRTVAASCAPVRATPRSDAEQVTQVLYGEPVRRSTGPTAGRASGRPAATSAGSRTATWRPPTGRAPTPW